MKIIVGLGNKGKRYVKTRHNVGFWVIDKIAEKEKILLKESLILQSYIGKKKIDNEIILLVKPLTYMNLSGIVVKKVVGKYKQSADNLLLIYDDVDLSLGKIRFRRRGSSGGHKGIQSVIEALETNEIQRLKIGIGPKEEGDLADYVLEKFSPEEEEIINKVIDRAAQCCWDWIDKPAEWIMHRYNS